MDSNSEFSKLHNLDGLQDMAHKLRIHTIEMTDKANSGHPTSCSSMAEALSVLFFDKSGMKFHPKDPKNPANDKFILSKGHAAPIYYAAWAEAGNFPVEDLLTLRKITSDIEGHPTPRLSFCDVATGSLGQGLGFACGSAYSSKYVDKINNRYFTLMGDGEAAEGSVWEAAHFASHYVLDNMVAFIDCNRLGQSDVTSLGHHVEVYHKRFEAFGWHSITVDGHNVTEIIKALDVAKTITGKPTAIILKTNKGKYFTDVIDDQLNWHGKPVTLKNSEIIRAELTKMMKNPSVTLTTNPPEFTRKWDEEVSSSKFTITPNYKSTDKVSTRVAYGNGLKKLGDVDKFEHIMAYDADVKNSTFSETLEKAYPKKFVNCYIAEQNMVSVALGASKRNKIPFCSTFACFFTRAFDQIRMGAISFANVKFMGSHTGVHIGEDGPSQMGLEDLNMFRAIPNALVLFPSDAVSSEKAVELAANYHGMVYIKGGRNSHPILYPNEEQFEAGKCKIIKQSSSDAVTVISAGPPLHELVKAHEILAKDGLNIRLIDIFSVKPIDTETLRKSISETNGLAFIAEDHYPEGGIGESVFSALKDQRGFVYGHRAVTQVPRSGSPEELYEMFGLSSTKLAEEIKQFVSKNKQ